MRSISLNKNLRLILALLFILCNFISFGQNLDLLIKKKSETKEFLQQLVIVYGNDLKKIRKNDSKVLSNTQETVYDDKQKYSFAFEININKKILTFKTPKLSTQYSYPGSSKNLERLFKNIETEDQATVATNAGLTKKFLNDPTVITLDGKELFIKRYYNRMWRKYRRPDRLTIGVFGGVNFSTAFVSPFRYSDDTELKTKTRRENEEYLPTGVFGFSMGYSHYSHGIDAFFQRTNYGCKFADGNQIDWNTGFYDGDSLISDSSKFSLPVGQWGIRYRYSNYFRKVSPYVVIGIHVSYASIRNKNLLHLNSQYLSTGCNLGLGINFHPIYALDIHIAPVMNVSFNSVKGTELQTRFSSLALELGLRYNIAFIRRKFTTNAK